MEIIDMQVFTKSYPEKKFVVVPSKFIIDEELQIVEVMNEREKGLVHVASDGQAYIMLTRKKYKDYFFQLILTQNWDLILEMILEIKKLNA